MDPRYYTSKLLSRNHNVKSGKFGSKSFNFGHQWAKKNMFLEDKNATFDMWQLQMV